MAIQGNIQRFFGSVKELVTPIAKSVGSSAGKVGKAGFKGAVGLGNKTLDGIEAIGKVDKKALVSNIKSNTGKATDYILGSGGPSQKQTVRKTRMGQALDNSNVSVSGKLNLLDEVGVHTRGISEAMYSLGKGSQFDIKLGANKSVKLNTGLFKASDTSLIGIKATGLGTAGLMAASTLSGVGDAGKKFNQDRQGYRDGQAQGHAPQQYTSAYQNNGGATGDLVFALNNLRHGGQI